MSLSPENFQNVTHIVKDHLTEYPIDFPGWSGLVRRTAAKYPELTDPLKYMSYQWRSDRWRTHCKKIIYDYWDNILIAEAKEHQEPGQSLELFDVSGLSASRPHRLWTAAGRISCEVTKACIVSWMLLGVYYTRDKLHKYKMVDSSRCICCPNLNLVEESLFHVLLSCETYDDIRAPYLAALTGINHSLSLQPKNPDNCHPGSGILVPS